MVSICFHFGLLVALFGSFVVCDDRASLSSVSEVIRNNKESITKINDTLISLMESRQLGMCGQEVILKEEEMFQKSGEILSLAIATFNSLEISLRELTAQIDKNNCDQERRSNCSRGEWTCGSGECIPDRSYCDGRPDCQDSSDEASGCQVQCSEDEFKCEADNECLPSRWVCDGEEDCSDGSDEETCPSVQCSENEFKCEEDNECLPSQWVCDGEEDCSDGSDEETCPSEECVEGFRCLSDAKCILSKWVCDKIWDCDDGSDEHNCTNTTATTTPENEVCREGFRCLSSNECVFSIWVCDGDQDCDDGSDEQNCTTTTTNIPVTTTPKNEVCNEGFRCLSSNECVFSSWVCDGDQDCDDGSDEYNCTTTTTNIPVTTTFQNVQCSENEFKCEADNECLPSQWVCDGEEDCSDGSDEETCPSVQCSENEFMCEADNECLPSQWVCDGEEDCSDGSDEETCPSVITTTPPPGNERKDDPCTDHRCSHDCLASPLSPEGYTCLCPKGMALFHDRLTCVLPFTKRPFVEYLEVKNNIGSPFSGVKGATH